MATITNTIQRNSWWFTLAIFISGLATFAGIFIIKKAIGDNDYAIFNTNLNACIIAGFIGQGWVSQLAAQFLQQKKVSENQLLKYALYSAIVLLLIAALTLFALNLQQWILTICILIFPISIYLSLLAIAQGNLKPHLYFRAELLRSSFLIAGLIILYHQPAQVAYWYWLLYVLTYLAGAVYLVFNLPIFKNQNMKQLSLKASLKIALPMSAWWGILLLIFFIDRFFLLKYITPKIAGNYAAIADVMIKGCGFILSPLVTAAQPQLAKLFGAGNNNAITQTVKQIAFKQIAMLAILVAGYCMFYKIMFNILQVPVVLQANLFWCGLAILAGAGIWQINTIVQKPLEHKLKIGWLAIAIFVALCTSVAYNFLTIKTNAVFNLSLSILLSAIVYLGLMIFLKRKH